MFLAVFLYEITINSAIKHQVAFYVRLNNVSCEIDYENSYISQLMRVIPVRSRVRRKDKSSREENRPVTALGYT